MNFRIKLLTFLWLLAALQTRAQNSYMQRLAVINKQMVAAWMQHDVTGLLRIYTDNAVSMPEFHQTLYGKDAIAGYLGKWMDSAKTSSYSRQTHDITKAGKYLVETGTFRNKFFLREKTFDYAGKYLNIWQIRPDGGLQLVSEITGSTGNLERSDLPLSALQMPNTAILPKPKTDRTATTIQSLNDEVAALVVQRKGKDFVKYYTPDAIYMPYYRPMLIGKAAIDAYYIEHEDPNAMIDAVHISTTRIITTDNYVLADGFYKVNWGGSGSTHGTVTGKNINVWKRGPDGKLLLFRQMTVHD